MFDRFSQHNKKILSSARQAAVRLGHPYIGTEHILLAVLELDHCGAARMMRLLGVDRGELQSAIEDHAEMQHHDAPQMVGTGLPFTPQAKQALEHTLDECAAQGHEHVRSEHLLLGLLRAEKSAASAALRDVGITLAAARQALSELLATQPTHEPMQRRLLLISNSTMHGGGYLAHCSDEIRDFLGTEQKRVAFVPYALADHDGYEAKAKEAFAALGHELTSVHHAADPCTALAEADAVFVGGGNTFRLLKTLYDTGLLTAIRQRTGQGLQYIGSSAGTNVATLSIRTTNDMPIVMPPSFEALALVPFQINPHYLDPDPGSKHMGETREERLLQFHEENGTPVLAIREGCMLRVEGDRMELRGTTGARLFRPGQEPEEFTPPCDLSTLLQTAS